MTDLGIHIIVSSSTSHGADPKWCRVNDAGKELFIAPAMHADILIKMIRLFCVK